MAIACVSESRSAKGSDFTHEHAQDILGLHNIQASTRHKECVDTILAMYQQKHQPNADTTFQQGPDLYVSVWVGWVAEQCK